MMAFVDNFKFLGVVFFAVIPIYGHDEAAQDARRRSSGRINRGAISVTFWSGKES